MNIKNRNTQEKIVTGTKDNEQNLQDRSYPVDTFKSNGISGQYYL